MHEEQPGLVIQHVIVHRGHLDAIRPQDLDHWIYLGGEEHEIAVDCGVLSIQLEVQRRVHAHAARDRGAHRRYVDIVARRDDVEDAAAHTPFVTNDPLDLLG